MFHRLSLGELYYLARKSSGVVEADAQLVKLRKLPWDTSGPLNFELLRLAGALKTEHGVPYVDAIAGAWALLNDAALAATDRKGYAAAARAEALEVLFLR